MTRRRTEDIIHHLSEDRFQGKTSRTARSFKPGDFRAIFPEGVGVFTPNVHQSGMQDLLACPAYFGFRWRLGLRAKDAPPSAADRGTFFHRGAECLSLGMSWEETVTEVRKVSDVRLTQLRDYYVARSEEEKLAAVQSSLEARLATALAMLKVFGVQVPLLDQSRYQPILTEGLVVAEVPGVTSPGQITVDALLYDKKEKGLLIRDYKTLSSGRSVAQYASGLGWDFQFRWYRAVVHQHLKQHPLPKLGAPPVIGVLVDIIREPSISPKQWQLEQAAEDRKINPSLDPLYLYLEEVEDYYLGRPSRQTKTLKSGPRKGETVPLWDHRSRADDWSVDPPILRKLVLYTEEPLPQELRLLAANTGRACQCAPTLQNFPRWGKMLHRCSDWYGRPCPFNEFCASNTAYWPMLLDQRFRQVDPDAPKHGDPVAETEENPT